MNTRSKIRQLKISSSYHKQPFKRPVFRPKLTISGDWVEKAGFNIGDAVTVSVSQNLLIIQKL
jgi:toxic protein SymE